MFNVAKSRNWVTCSFLQVRLSLEDVNDTPPVFEDFSTIRFSEDTLPGEVVTTIRAYDADLESSVEYSLVAGDRNTFTIDPRTGELALLRTVDREVEELFRLVVRADDGQHHSDINVLITVSYLRYD